jgi:ubiquinone biosynthesis monooxygenase Coq7
MGEQAAYACTEAVEEVIEEHYARQGDELEGVDAELQYVVEKFRAEEVAHKETAIDQGARHAPGYPVLSAVIKFGCRAAIRISEKI